MLNYQGTEIKSEGCGMEQKENQRADGPRGAAMEPNERIILNLRDLGHWLQLLYEGKGSQKRILIILREEGGMTQRALTERLGIKPGSASEVLAKLENAGLILRTPSKADRRTAQICLTEAGRAQADQAAAQRKARHQTMFACLTQEEKQTLLRLTQKLCRDWQARYGAGEEP